MSFRLAARALAALGLLSGIFASTSLAQGEDPEFNRGMDAHKAKDYATSTAIFQKLYETSPAGQGKAAAAYNVACGLALLGKRETDAFAWLDKSVLAGFGRGGPTPGQPAEKELARVDTDLDSLRKDARFPKFLESVDKNAAAAAGGGGGLASSPSVSRADVDAETKEALLYAPESLDPKTPAPLVVLCHGAGQNKKDFLEKKWKDVADAAGIRLASVSGSVATRPNAYNWLSGGFASYPQQAEAIEARLKAAVDQARAKFAVDEKRVWLSGFSQGGLVALHAATRNPDLFRGAIVVAGAMDAPTLDAAAPEAAKKGLRVVILVGSEDSRGLAMMTQAHEALKKAGVASDLRTFPVGHDFPKERVAEVRKALETLAASGGAVPAAASKPAGGGQ